MKSGHRWDAAVETLCLYLEGHGEISEGLRARVHALTRKVTMSDDDLATVEAEAYAEQDRRARSGVADLSELRFTKMALQDLRDRYEERGEYEVKL